MLLSAGANWKIGEKDGYTCMHGAAFQGLSVYTHVHAISNLESRRPTALMCVHATSASDGRMCIIGANHDTSFPLLLPFPSRSDPSPFRATPFCIQGDTGWPRRQSRR